MSDLPLFSISGESIAPGRPVNMMLLGLRSAGGHPLVEKIEDDLFPQGPRGRTQYTVIQAVDVPPARDISHDPFERVEVIVFCVSAETTQDEWFRREFSSFYTSYPGRHQVPIIPVLLDDAPVPSALATTRTVDLSGNYRAGIKKLIMLLGSKAQNLLALVPSPDDQVLHIADRISRSLILYFREHPDQLKRVDRRLFEEMIAHLFSEFGYVVELTQRTRDGGRDVIAVRTQIVTVKYLIECKRPDPDGYVGVKPVRELYGVLEDEGATKGVLVTTTHFSPEALKFFERHRWELEPKDFTGLMGWIEEYNRLVSPTGAPNGATPADQERREPAGP